MWKLTADELPPEDVKVLAFYAEDDAIGWTDYIDVVMRNEDDWFDQEGWGVDAPTHWMAIPDLPNS